MNRYNPYSIELYHHGVLGQKWGVRRYQYEDGSLTPEGKKHYYNYDGTLNKHGQKELKKRQKEYSKLEKKHYTKYFNAAADEFNSTQADWNNKYMEEHPELRKAAQIVSRNGLLTRDEMITYNDYENAAYERLNSIISKHRDMMLGERPTEENFGKTLIYKYVR